MLTKRQNMMEVIRGGNPDRFVKQYEGLTFVLNTPYQPEGECGNVQSIQH